MAGDLFIMNITDEERQVIIKAVDRKIQVCSSGGNDDDEKPMQCLRILYWM